MQNVQKSDIMINHETKTQSIRAQSDDSIECSLQDGQGDQVCRFRFVTIGVL